jgi:hypothetical protein
VNRSTGWPSTLPKGALLMVGDPVECAGAAPEETVAVRPTASMVAAAAIVHRVRCLI